MHLVIGVDDSPCSAAAIEFVRRMNWPAKSTATIVQSLPPFVMVAPEVSMAMADSLDGVRRHQRAFNEEHARECAIALIDGGLKAEPSAPEGDPRRVLVDTAREEHADLLVVGSHGRSAVARLLLGSVASHVVNHAPCSVLVVRERVTGRGRP